eukprot:6172761-Pleurochrysis_carterae.AAC.1
MARTAKDGLPRLQQLGWTHHSPATNIRAQTLHRLFVICSLLRLYRPASPLRCRSWRHFYASTYAAPSAPSGSRSCCPQRCETPPAARNASLLARIAPLGAKAFLGAWHNFWSDLDIGVTWLALEACLSCAHLTSACAIAVFDIWSASTRSAAERSEEEDLGRKELQGGRNFEVGSRGRGRADINDTRVRACTRARRTHEHTCSRAGRALGAGDVAMEAIATRVAPTAIAKLLLRSSRRCCW